MDGKEVKEDRDRVDEDAPPPAERDGSVRRDGDEATPALLPLYLREMGETPLLHKEQEVELSRELQESREALARLALRLPAACRQYSLQGDTAGPRRGGAWPLEDLERFYERLLRYEREQGEPRVTEIVARARRQRRRLDAARDALILSNLRLVAHIAKKYLNHGMSFMDLIQEGNIGLMKAVEKFEYKRGNRFSTYAYWWIKQAIARAIADKARTIRIPVHVGEKMKKISRVTAELSETLGRRPTPVEIGRKLRMPLEKIEEILSVVPDAQSLEEFGARDERGDPLRVVADPAADSPFERTLDRELREKVDASLDALDPREREILRLRFGIGRARPHTLEDIGRLVHLSRERVRQIEDAALKKILAHESCEDLEHHFVER